MEIVKVSFYFPGMHPCANPETRTFTGDSRDFSKWIDRQTGGPNNEKWIKWGRQSTVTFPA